MPENLPPRYDGESSYFDNPVTPETDEFGRPFDPAEHIDSDGIGTYEWAVRAWRDHGADDAPMPRREDWPA